MSTPLDLVSGAEPFHGPDLTRYFVVCALTIGGLIGAAWLFKRTLAGRWKARAARRSLQVLDVLPLGGKQKLMVVRCYDRSFLLGVGEKEVRSIAELEAQAEGAAESATSDTGLPFAHVLERELVPAGAPTPAPVPTTRDLRAGVLA